MKQGELKMTDDKNKVYADSQILLEVEGLKRTALEAGIFEKVRFIVETDKECRTAVDMAFPQVKRTWGSLGLAIYEITDNVLINDKYHLKIDYSDGSMLGVTALGKNSRVGQVTIKLVNQNLDDLVVFDAERFAYDANAIRINSYLMQNENLPQGNWENRLSQIYVMAWDKRMKAITKNAENPLSVQDANKYNGFPKNFGVELN